MEKTASSFRYCFNNNQWLHIGFRNLRGSKGFYDHKPGEAPVFVFDLELSDQGHEYNQVFGVILYYHYYVSQDDPSRHYAFTKTYEEILRDLKIRANVQVANFVQHSYAAGDPEMEIDTGPMQLRDGEGPALIADEDTSQIVITSGGSRYDQAPFVWGTNPLFVTHELENHQSDFPQCYECGQFYQPLPVRFRAST
jgi:hypothetical protein